MDKKLVVLSYYQVINVQLVWNAFRWLILLNNLKRLLFSAMLMMSTRNLGQLQLTRVSELLFRLYRALMCVFQLGKMFSRVPEDHMNAPYVFNVFTVSNLNQSNFSICTMWLLIPVTVTWLTWTNQLSTKPFQLHPNPVSDPSKTCSN